MYNQLLPIQSLWIGKTLSKVEQLCITSFLRNGHEFHLYTYDEVKNVPDGTILKSAEEILPRNKIFTIKDGWGKGSYAGFADLFRIQLLYAKGGWWVDTDVICLKPFHFDNDLVISTSYEGVWGTPANNCILKISKGHPILKYLINYIDNLIIEDIQFGDTGPHLIQEAVRELNLHDALAPYYYFNPISWSNVKTKILGFESINAKIKDFIRPFIKPSTIQGRNIGKESFSIHLWNEIWRQNGFDKNISYSKSSIFEKLKMKYDV